MRRADTSARYITECHAITRAVYKQQKSDWLAGDGPPSAADFEFVVDGGLRLAPAIANLVSSTTGASFFTDLNKDFPYPTAHISWGGTEDPNVEIQRVIANLHPKQTGSPKEVVWWRCQLKAVSKITGIFDQGSTATPTMEMIDLATAIDVRATGEAAGDVTFDFSALTVKPKPKTIPVRFGGPGIQLRVYADFPEYWHPTTVVIITALKADGSPAGNVGWGYDNAIQTFGTGNILRSKNYDNQIPGFGGFIFPVIPGQYADRGTAGGVPKITIQTGSFTAKTITFSSGNLLDLGAAPTGSVYLSALADTPPGTSVTTEIRNDADTAWVAYTDGQPFSDLGLTATQTRKVQATLTPDAGGTLTPTLRRLGMEEKVVVDLSGIAEVTNYKQHCDPVTLVGQPTQATIRGIKNGRADFRSTIEDLLTTYDIGALEFRWYYGDTRLNRSHWVFIDAFPVVDDFEPNAASVGIELFGANALVSSALPRYDSSGSGVEIPDSTVSIGSWTDQAGGVTNIHLTLDEDPPDDTDYVRSPGSPANAAVEFGLTNLADPNRDTGHFVDFRMKKDTTGGEVLTIVVRLMQGAVEKMVSDPLTVPDEWTDVSVALSAAQAQSISDYTDLRLRFTANASGAGSRRAYVSWAQLRVTGQRSAVVYTNQPADVVCADLLSQAEVPARYKGQGITSTLAVSKTITSSNALDELRSLAAVFGYAVTSSRGAIQAVDMFGPRGIAAYLPPDRVNPIRIVPGFRERRPRVSVPWNWSNERDRFEDEVVWQSTPALTKLGPGRLDAEEKWNEESGKWIYSEAQAKEIARRTGQALGTGLILWRFRCLDQYPSLELGDRIAVGSSRFLAKDPHSSRALRGNLSALATLTDCEYTGGFWEFTGWVQSYADVLSVGFGSLVSSATPESVILEDAHALYALGKLYVNWRGNSDVRSVKIARSAVSFPAAGTGTAYDGRTGVQDTGVIPYNTPTFVTVTGYSGISGTGTQSAEVIQFTANYAITNPIMINPGTGLIDPAGSTSRNRCSVFHSANVAINDVTLTTLNWDSENFDTGTLHDTATNNTRITIPADGAPGLWLLVCQVRWIGVTVGAAGQKYVNIRKNGGTIVAENSIAAVPVTAAGNATVQTAIALQSGLSVGDYFEVQVYHDDGASRSVQGGSWLSFFAAHHLW